MAESPARECAERTCCAATCGTACLFFMLCILHVLHADQPIARGQPTTAVESLPSVALLRPHPTGQPRGRRHHERSSVVIPQAEDRAEVHTGSLGLARGAHAADASTSGSHRLERRFNASAGAATRGRHPRPGAAASDAPTKTMMRLRAVRSFIAELERVEHEVAARNATPSVPALSKPSLVVTRRFSGRMQTGCVGGCFR